VPTGNHFLAIRLEGRTCNRDAIGARVKVQLDGTAAKPLIRTLRAGEGFLAQSSKWLHFGLGRSTSIEKVTVRWPGGEVETFTGLQPDHQYHLTQGTGEARRWTRPPGATPLAPTILAGKPPTSAGRTFLAAGPLLPHISYRDREGAQRSLNLSSKGPTLVNLWASWCAPCAEELPMLAELHREWAEDGLPVQVIGVSVDSNVVYFEHLKEDIRDGRTARSSVDKAFPVAFSTIVKADMASLIGAGLLWWLTVGAVRGFALYLGLATLLDLVATYFFMGPMVRLMAQSRWFAEHPERFGLPASGAVSAVGRTT